MPTEVALEGEQLGNDGTQTDVATHMECDDNWESGEIREELPHNVDTGLLRCHVVAKRRQLIEKATTYSMCS